MALQQYLDNVSRGEFRASSATDGMCAPPDLECTHTVPRPAHVIVRRFDVCDPGRLFDSALPSPGQLLAWPPDTAGGITVGKEPLWISVKT